MALDDLNNDVVDEGFACELYEPRKSACERIKVYLRVVLGHPRLNNFILHQNHVESRDHGNADMDMVPA